MFIVSVYMQVFLEQLEMTDMHNIVRKKVTG